MRIEETVTYLEMTSRDQLVPARIPEAPIDPQEVDQASLALVRSIYGRIGEPYGWIARAGWSDDDWRELLRRPEVRVWVASIAGDPAGVIELEAGSAGDVGISVFGLVPERVGRGYGGHLLTRASELAWGMTSPDGSPPTRVWLHTSSRDHPHALSNYQRRGFRPYRTERRQREVPEGTTASDNSAGCQPR